MRRRAAQRQTEKTQYIRVETDDVYGGVIPERAGENLPLHELAASIARRGLLQPIIVRRCAEAGRFALVCGTRRLAACRLLGIKEIDAVLICADAQEGAACFMEEHLLRRTPCAMDEAQVIEAADESLIPASAEMERRIKRRRSLLGLAPRTRQIVSRFGLSCDQAYPLTLIGDLARQQEAALIIAERSLTPLQARRLAVGPPAQQGAETGGRRRATKTALAEIHALARRMRAQGMDVRVAVHSQEGGMCIQFLLQNGEKANSQQETGKE